MIDYNSQLNREVVQLKPSGIRRFFDIANEMDEVISLSRIFPRRGTSVRRGFILWRRARRGIPRTVDSWSCATRSPNGLIVITV